MKMLFNKILIIFFIASTPTFACIDKNARRVPMDAVLDAAEKYPTLAACLDKLAAKGVDLISANAFRVNRRPHSAQSDGPIAYTYIIQGLNSQEQLTQIRAHWSLDSRSFACVGPTTNLPKCR